MAVAWSSTLNFAAGCPSRKSHPALRSLKLERSSVILLHRPAHLHSDGLLHTYGPHLGSLFAHPESHRAPNSTRGRNSRAASATSRSQPENSPVLRQNSVRPVFSITSSSCSPLVAVM